MFSQCNQFFEKIKEINQKNYFLKKMPKIRVSKYSNHDTDFIFKNIKNSNNNILTISQNLLNNNNNNNSNNTNNNNSNNNENNNINNLINNLKNNKNSKKLKHASSINPLENILGIPNNLISRDKLFSALRIYSTKLSTQLHPSSRGKFSYIITEDYNLFIFGGIQSKSFNDLWQYNFSKNIWTKIEIFSELPLARYAHSMSFYNDNIYIFGGTISLQQLLIHNRENNITIFDMKNKKYYFPFCYNSRNVPWRRNHIGIGIGNTKLIYGGINDEGEILNDMWVFEYSKLKWNPLEYRTLIEIPSLAYHNCCLVVKNRAIIYHNDFSVYKIPEGSINKNVKNKPKIEGVYIFGGISDKNHEYNVKNKKKKNNMNNINIINNENENNNNENNTNLKTNYFKDLFVIKIGTKPVDIFRIPTKGKLPLPRIDFSMSYYNYLNFLVIYGGKYEGIIINEIMFLDLETLSWIRPLYDENDIKKITENVIISINEKIYILGGLGNEGFEKFEFNIINFDIFENSYNNNNLNEIMANQNQN
jgi:hypothetical protein